MILQQIPTFVQFSECISPDVHSWEYDDLFSYIIVLKNMAGKIHIYSQTLKAIKFSAIRLIFQIISWADKYFQQTRPSIENWSSLYF